MRAHTLAVASASFPSITRFCSSAALSWPADSLDCGTRTRAKCATPLASGNTERETILNTFRVPALARTNMTPVPNRSLLHAPPLRHTAHHDPSSRGRRRSRACRPTPDSATSPSPRHPSSTQHTALEQPARRGHATVYRRPLDPAAVSPIDKARRPSHPQVGCRLRQPHLRLPVHDLRAPIPDFSDPALSLPHHGLS